MKRILLYLFPISFMLSGCHIYDNYENRTTLPFDGLYRDTASSAALAAADTVNFGNMPWRQVYTDPQLQQLIETALQKNTNLLEADLTIYQAEQGLKVSRLAYLPQLVLSPQGTISSWDRGKATKVYNIPVNASWQIGAIGSLRNAKKQAEMSLLQSKAAKQAVQLNIISAVANLYYTLLMLDEQHRTTTSTIALWEDNVKTMEAMAEAGMTNQAAVAQAKANLIEIKSSVPTLEQSISQSENALCSILHEAAHSIPRAASFNADGFPAQLSVGIPLQLLSCRPDVKIAELNMANTFYGVQKARASFYPQITISGTAGWTNSGGMGIVNPGKLLATAVGSLVQPLFMNGRLTAQLNVAKAQQQAAVLDFEQALLKAGNEVSDNLAAYQTSIRKAELRTAEVKELEVALEHTQDLFRYTNTTSYLETLTAQQSLLNARLALTNDKFAKVQSVISLYGALGGGREN